MTGVEVGFRHRVDSIDWYYELRGEGPVVVLIPSGEGDCGSFEKAATILSGEFTVLTFDMPGFSRTSDPPNFVDYSLTQAAGEIAALVRSLGLSPATFYGCSSGGVVALCLTSDHSELVREVVVHEVPLSPPGEWLSRLTMLDDDQIIRACQDRFRNQMNENAEAWDALGKAYHRRLERNYVTWVHHYIQQNRYLRTFTTEELQRRSIIWTIGGLNPVEAFFDNVVMAHTAGIPIGLLRCRHFPQVSVPEVIAAHIGKAAREANILHK